jgi:iron complex transport system permease protein
MQIKFILLVLLIGILALTNLSIGSSNLSIETLLRATLFDGTNLNAETILWDFRMPKIITAILAGAALSVSGLLMQSFFQNPMAGPFVLGISSGASLGIALLYLASGWLSSLGFLHFILQSTSASLIMAMLGAGILGLLFGSASSALVGVLQFFSSQQALQQYVFWTMGSLSNTTWFEVLYLAIFCMLGIFFSYLMGKSLDTFLLGEPYARSMGLNTEQLKRRVITITAILAGSVTAFCGPVAFIGIAVPHLSRLLFKTHKHHVLIPAGALLGMITLLFCQLIAQLPGSERILPINMVTSFLGAPMVIWIVLKGKKI